MTRDPHQGDRSRAAIEQALRCWQTAVGAVISERVRGGLSVRNVADRFGIGRGTAHNLVRLLQSETLPGIAASLPGRTTRETLLARCRMAKAPSSLLDSLDAAQSALEATLASHAPTTDRLIALACGDASDDDLRRRLLRGFRSRFEIDQLMHGGSAETLVAAQIVVPSEDGRSADVAGLQIIDGIRFVRPETQFEVYRGFMRRSGRPSEPLQQALQEPLCSGLDRIDLAEHCDEFKNPRISSFLIEPSPTYDDGEVTLAYCEHCLERGPLDSPFEDDFAEVACPIFLPVRQLRFEIWLGREMRRGGDPVPLLYHNLATSPKSFDRHDRARVPLPADLQLVDDPLAGDDLTPGLAARYASLVDIATGRLRCGVADLDCFRVSLPCPPMGGRVAVRWLLAKSSEQDASSP